MPATPMSVSPGDGRCGRTWTLLGGLPGHAHPHQITSRAGRAVDQALGKKRPVWALGLSGAPPLTGIAPKPGRLGPGAREGRPLARHHALGPPSARWTPERGRMATAYATELMVMSPRRSNALALG